MYGEGDISVPVEDLRAAGFGDEVERVATAVAAYLDDGAGSNVAVVSDPFAGRDALLAYAESLVDGAVTRVELGPSAADGTGPDLPDLAGADRTGESDDDNGDAGAVVVANCHHLFERRIDGFAALDAFLDRIALTDALVITSWNRYAWSYLDAVRDVGDTFQTTVEIPPLDADEIRTVVEAHHGPDLPDAVDAGGAGRVRAVVFDGWTVGVGGRSITVPYPRLNAAWLASWSVSGTEERLEAATFEKLRRVSNGNPGVALAVWAESVADGEIAPGYVEAFEPALDVDDDAAILLWAALTAESIGVDRLAATYAERPVETSIQELARRGLVTVDGGRVSVPPRALSPAADALDRRGLLW